MYHFHKITVAMVMVAAVALTSATYAWFVNNTQVKAQTATMTASTAYTLLISKGAKASDGTSDWGSTHDWADGKESKEISPVSTVGTLNSSKELEFVYDTAWKAATADSAGVVKGGNYASTFATATANRYIKESFEIKASQDCQLVLDNLTEIKGASGELDRTLRLALVINDGTSQTVNIYQVNTDAGTATQMNTTLDSSDATADGISKAISNTGVVADIDVSAKKLTLANDKNEANGASAVMSNQGTDSSVLYNFDISTKDTVTVTAYIWMEGCDYDCNALETQNFKGADGALPVTASLSFSAALPTT